MSDPILSDSDHGHPAEKKPIMCAALFAVKEESRFCKLSPHALGFLTGMGMVNAERTVDRLLRHYAPKFVLTCGFAGGLNPYIQSCDIVYDADHGSLLERLLEESNARKGRFHCSHRVAVTTHEKFELHKITGADAVDMESDFIRDICRECGVPSATIRVISDSSEENLPLNFNTLMNSSQKLDFKKLGFVLLRNPLKVGELLEFQKKIVQASKVLGAFLNDFVARLAQAEGASKP